MAEIGVSNARGGASALLENLKRDVPDEHVTLGWLFDYVRARSPESLILFLAVLAVVPGVATPVGIALLALAVAAAANLQRPALPGFVAATRLSSSSLLRAIERAAPLFRRCEQLTRRRDLMLGGLLRPLAAGAILLLSVTLLVPLPLSNVVPALAIGFIAFAILEADEVLLAISLLAAVLSLTFTSAAVWAALGTAAHVLG